ncbi:MAG: hypothetical protein IKT20_05925 [Clostridiales bacterium]|nr:hypothetical protein [Clostridiales bacterium]
MNGLFGIYYVKLKGEENRKEFIKFLEKNGYKCEEDSYTTRESTIGSRYPVKVDLGRKVYGHIHNITCAAAAEASMRVFRLEGFLEFFESCHVFIIV